MSVVTEPTKLSKYIDILQESKVIENGDCIQEIFESLPLGQGVHITSDCKWLTIKFKQNSQREPLEIFVKQLPEKPSKLLATWNVYWKESQFYNVLLKDMKRPCFEKGAPDMLNIFPNVYYATEKELWLENLSKQGYSVLNMANKLDIPQAKSVLSHLARFHAATYILILENKGPELTMIKYPCATETVFLRQNKEIGGVIFENSMIIALDLLEKSKLPNAKWAYDKLSKYNGKTFYAMCDAAESKGSIETILWGDSWLNNILFKIDENTKEIMDLKFIDMQVTRFGTPTRDIAYLLYTSLKLELRKTQWKILLHWYFTNFQQNIETLGSKSNLTYDDFLEDFKRNSKLGFFFGIFGPIADNVFPHFNKSDKKEIKDDIMQELSLAAFAWIKDNPSKSEEIAQTIIEVVEEYNQIGYI